MSALQKPDATPVAGIRTWNELGRYVKKGQKGIPVLAPMIGTKRPPTEEPVEQTDKPKPTLIGFRVVYVFDKKDYLVICGRDFTRSNGTAAPNWRTPSMTATKSLTNLTVSRGD